MNSKYSLAQVLEKVETLVGESVSLDAILVIQAREAYLVESVDDPQSLRRIVVHCPRLELLLDQSVGGWMGGGYSYIDPVCIKGKLEAGTTRRSSAVLSDVTELTLLRDGDSTRISLV